MTCQSLPLFRGAKDSHGEARTLHGIASCQGALGDNAAALENLKALLPLVHASEDRQWEGMVSFATNFLKLQTRVQSEARCRNKWLDASDTDLSRLFN
jgi:hypothetical protein